MAQLLVVLGPCVFIVGADGYYFFFGNIETVGPIDITVGKVAWILNFIGGKRWENDFFKRVWVNYGDVEVTQYFFNERK